MPKKSKENKNSFEYEYEIIGQSTFRTKVKNGWIVREDSWVNGDDMVSSIAFIPDPLHEWEIVHYKPKSCQSCLFVAYSGHDTFNGRIQKCLKQDSILETKFNTCPLPEKEADAEKE